MRLLWQKTPGGQLGEPLQYQDKTPFFTQFAICAPPDARWPGLHHTCMHPLFAFRPSYQAGCAQAGLRCFCLPKFAPRKRGFVFKPGFITLRLREKRLDLQPNFFQRVLPCENIKAEFAQVYSSCRRRRKVKLSCRKTLTFANKCNRSLLMV